VTRKGRIGESPRIVIESQDERVEATLWLDGCPVEGYSDSTGTLSTRSLVAPLIDRFDRDSRTREGVESVMDQSVRPPMLTPRQEIRVLQRIAKAFDKLTPAGQRWVRAYLNDPKRSER
jgi:hypothetical protein